MLDRPTNEYVKHHNVGNAEHWNVKFLETITRMLTIAQERVDQ